MDNQSKNDCENAIQFIKHGDLAGGLRCFDRILENDPLNIGVFLALRKVETKLNGEWKTQRDLFIANQITNSSGEERLKWIWRTGQFYDAPASMAAAWQYIMDNLFPQLPDTTGDRVVTIVLTAHNHEKYIEEALRSVIAQTETAWELIIVNDNSTDNTTGIIKNFVKKHSDYDIISLTLPGVGTSRARNAGAEQGSAPFIFFLDADDMIAADYTEKLLPVLTNDDTIGFAYPISLQKGKFNRTWSNHPFEIFELLIANRMPVNSLMRRKMFDQLSGFSPEMVGAYEDWDFWIMAVRAGWKGKLCPEAFFLYRKLVTSRNTFDADHAREVEAKKILIRRNAECYIPGADKRDDLLLPHPRIHQDLVNRDWVREHKEKMSKNILITDNQIAVPVAQTVNHISQDTGILETNTESRIVKKYSSERKLRVLISFMRNVHVPILQPIADLLREDSRVELGYFVFQGSSEERLFKNSGIPLFHKPQDFKPHVTFIADNFTEQVKGCGYIINVGHGLLSKGQYFTNSDFIHRENLEHLLLVPGPYHKNRMLESGKIFIPVEATGFPKLDKIFKSNLPGRNELLKQIGLDPSKKVVLYAPTFNIALSAIPILWMRIRELVDENTYLFIKLHGSTLGPFIEHHRKLADEHENIFYIEDNDLSPYLLLADVMVSDVSSASMEFILLDKPVVLFNNPNAPDYSNFDPDDIEWAWRDVGIQANDINELKEGVRRSLKNPGEFSEKRKRYSKELLISSDGLSSKRTIEKMWELVEADLQNAPRDNCKRTAIILKTNISDLQSHMPLIDQLSQAAGSEHDIFIYTDEETDNTAFLDNIVLVNSSNIAQLVKNFEYMVYIEENVKAGDRWIFRLVNHLRRNPTIDAVVPMISGQDNSLQSPSFILGNNEGNQPPEMIENIIPWSHLAELTDTKGIPSNIAGAVRNGGSAWNTLLEYIISNQGNPFTNAKIALDVLVCADKLHNEKQTKNLRVTANTNLNEQSGNRIENRINGRLRLAKRYAEKGLYDKALKHAETLQATHRDDIDLQKFIEYLHQKMNDTISLTTNPSPVENNTESQMIPALESSPEIQKPVRALIYFFKNVHIPILLPIWNEMKRQGGFEIAFAIHPYDRNIRAGMLPEEEAKFRKLPVTFVDNPATWNADVAVMADNVPHLVQNCGKIVNVGHGLLSKGQYFTDRDIVNRENMEDLLCVPGSYHRDRLLQCGKISIPVIATGFPKSDFLFDPGTPGRDELVRQSGLDPHKKFILHAPTFNMELSAIPILWTRVAELADENNILLIKLHSSTLPEFKQVYRELAQKHNNVLYVDDPDLTPYMKIADVMLSDVSSAYMEFMALDKPVVLFNNPNQKYYVNYDPNDIEYAWRDVGITVNTLEETKIAIRRSIAFPGEFSDIRRKYADLLLADRNGGATKRVIQAIRDLLDGKLEIKKKIHEYNSILERKK
ncbi:MAG: CDP-glycerol glycerophosphotransferase family protein [Candidatus Electryonea clarkiae]|nr:CDP-glycerol glycerophosphotransferase family protein [Candidatus Electryonea clarkiae]MDP8285981.1 CDP-glycerol glycerophosphotransferase family protein [Candidatus Electryonea clarkiae]